MLHPHTRLVWISDEIGYGIVATKFIPKGTITFADDALDIIIKDDSPLIHSPLLKNTIDRYSYMNSKGERVICWDFGKYMNHCCHPNTLTTGYGFEIAIKDIQAGEEIKDDYGLFIDDHEMTFVCQQENCRLKFDYNDYEKLAPEWNQKIQEALKKTMSVEQPLWAYLDEQTIEGLQSFQSTPSSYIPVNSQKPKRAS